MCDSCASPRHADGRRRGISALPMLIILLVGPLLLLQPLGITGGQSRNTEENNLADHVFVRDLAAQAAMGIELGEALVSRASHPRARALARRFLMQERLERRAALAAGGNAPARATARPAHMSDARLLHAAARHAREDVLLARIELRSGRNSRLKELARKLAGRQRVIAGALRSSVSDPQ
jgi:hypothetical protein